MEDMVNTSPSVSVIMNCFNSDQYLAEAIDSVFAQTFSSWEIIFFDNCSTDNSAMISKGYDGRLRYFRSEKTVPLGHARNLAIEKARGKYIAFLDCDDRWIKSKLARQVEALEADTGLGAVFSDALFFGQGTKTFRTFPVNKPRQGMIFRDLLSRYVLPMPTIIVRREALDNIGGWFDERFNMVEDADLFMRVAYYYPIAFVDDVLAHRRMHAASWTSMKKELFPKEEEMLLEKFAKLWPAFGTEYTQEIAHMTAIIQYQYAILDWEKGNNVKARHRMAPFLPVLKKLWVPFLFSYFPIFLYNGFKRSYKLATSSLTGSVDDQAF
jgi:glycosyltransferase involved in cell wall biosynthesis